MHQHWTQTWSDTVQKMHQHWTQTVQNAPALDTNTVWHSSECTSTGHKHSVTQFRKCTSTGHKQFRMHQHWIQTQCDTVQNAPALDTNTVWHSSECTSTGHKHSVTQFRMHQHWTQTQCTVWHSSENAPALNTNTVYSVTQFRKCTSSGHKHSIQCNMVQKMHLPWTQVNVQLWWSKSQLNRKRKWSNENRTTK